MFWFGVCYWIQFVLEVHGGMGRWGGWGTFLLFAVLKGLHMAVFTPGRPRSCERPGRFPAPPRCGPHRYAHGTIGLA